MVVLPFKCSGHLESRAGRCSAEGWYPMVGLVQWLCFSFFVRESNSTNLQTRLVQMTCEFISLSRPRNVGIDLTILIELKLILDEKAYLFYRFSAAILGLQ